MGTHPIFESDFDCLTDLIEMDEKTQRISDYSDRLARSILSEVVDDIKLAKIQEIKEQTDSAKSSPRLSRGQISNNNSSESAKVRKRKTAREEGEIDLLADRLTSDIISHATYTEKPTVQDRIKIHKYDTKSPDSPTSTNGQRTLANEYQKMVIEYQNQNGFEDDFDATTRRSSIWAKQPRATSIWNRTDD